MGLIRLEEHRAFAVWCDLMNLTLLSGRHIQVARRIAEHGPDVFLFRIVKLLRLSIGADAVDLPVGRCRRIDAVLRIDRDGVDFERIELRDLFAFAVRRNAEELCARTPRRVEIAV